MLMSPTIKPVEMMSGISPSPSERIPIENIAFFDPIPNDSQKLTAKFAPESPEVTCIYGPLGIIAILSPESNLNSVPRALGRLTLCQIEVIRRLMLTLVSSANHKPLCVVVCGASN